MTTIEPEPLPGLDVPTRTEPTRLEKAIRRTIKALRESEVVGEIDAARLELALTMERVIMSKLATGRMSTIGNDARVLMDLLDKMSGEDSGVDEQLRQAMESWAEAVTEAGSPTATATEEPAAT